MTKKLFLLTSYFILLTSCCYPQQPGYEPHDTKTEKQYKWGIGLQVNTIDRFFPSDNSPAEIGFYQQVGEYKDKSFSIGLNGHYFLDENIFWGFNFNINKVNVTYHRDTRDEYANGASVFSAIINATKKQNTYQSNPSIGWQIMKKGFSFYSGFEMPFTLFDVYLIESTQTNYDSTFTDIISSANSYFTIPGGFSVGLGVLGGINIYPLKHFIIGTNFSATYVYSRLGGKTETKTNIIIPAGQPSGYAYEQYSQEGLFFSGTTLSFYALFLFGENKNIHSSPGF